MPQDLFKQHSTFGVRFLGLGPLGSLTVELYWLRAAKTDTELLAEITMMGPYDRDHRDGCTGRLPVGIVAATAL